jgi:hypothetical protein
MATYETNCEKAKNVSRFDWINGGWFTEARK